MVPEGPQTNLRRVVADGVTVVENGLSVVHKGNLLAVYAQTARRAEVALPEAWRAKALIITDALTGQDITGQARVTRASTNLDLPAREPVLIRPAR